MSVEAELKALIHHPDDLHDQLTRRANPVRSVYRDTYYDRPDAALTRTGRELRLRLVDTDEQRRILLTYKEPAVDTPSGSKPEHETTVVDDQPIRVMFAALGLVEIIALDKHCTNYRFTERDRDLLATVVHVPELAGRFLELETIVPAAEVTTALDDLRRVLVDLGVSTDDLTTEQYTDAVRDARR